MSEYAKIAILGSTGSIGTQTLDVARRLGIKITALSANENVSLLEEQIREFKPQIAAVFSEEKAEELKIKIADTETKVVSGLNGLCEAATAPSADTVVTAVSGMIGLLPTVEAIKADKNIALANKETLVVAGEIIMPLAKKYGVKILPVDSEHSAIFQCLMATRRAEDLEKVVLTCSGGPFFGKTRRELSEITPERALKHPTWKMGRKISIDSATLMNKGLELIEAVHLFGVTPSKVEVLIHRESIVHSMIKLKDGAMLAQLSNPDMRLPIEFALTYPYRNPSPTPELDLSEIGSLTFSKPDEKTFTLLPLCRRAIEKGGNIPCVANAANEEAVGLFLKNRISFTDIFDGVAAVTDSSAFEKDLTIEKLLEYEKESRLKIRKLFNCED